MQTKNCVGVTFRTQGGTVFKVLQAEYFPRERIANQHRWYLSGLGNSLLVSVSFYGQPVPLITVDEGVVRLIQIECEGEVLKTALVISKVLGVTVTRQPARLSFQ